MLPAHLVAATRPEARAENIAVFGDVRVTVLADRLFRLEKSPAGFLDGATQAVFFRDMPPVRFTASEARGAVTVRTDAVTLTFRTSDLTGSARVDGRRASLTNRGNLGGTTRTLDGCDGPTFIPYDGSAPSAVRLGAGVASRTGVAIYDDSESLLLREDGSLAPRPAAERDLYVFCYGRDYRAAVRALYAICGGVPLIPRFALGNWWSRYFAYAQNQYLDLMDRFAARGVPLTVATVDMDWHWSTTLDARKGITASGKNDEAHGGADGWTGYSWNTDLFPDHRAFLAALHARGLRVTLNLHPALGVRYFEDMYPAMCEAMGVDPASEKPIPFDIANERFLRAYFDVLHKPYEREGVDFWWIDWQQGTRSRLAGLDPLWALNHYHTLDIAREKQPLILSRYCGVGSHRYPLGFSGDTHVTWKTLRYMPYFTATAANVGYGWWSHDIGGHQCGAKDDELYVRFLQFGVFSPINRLHCTCSPVFSKEPAYYMNGAGSIAEDFLRLRHRMIPLLFSAAVVSSERGQALVEPMYYEWPEAREAYRCPGQYLFAGRLIVAPVTEKTDASGMAGVTLWLPEGEWTDVFTGDVYRGGRRVRMLRWLDSLPVLAGPGAILPLDGRREGNDSGIPDKLDVLVFGGDGEYALREDGEGFCSAFATRERGGERRVRVRSAVARSLRVALRGIPEGEVSVRRGGHSVPFETARVGDALGLGCLSGPDCLSVRFEAEAGEEYEIVARYAPDDRARFLERLEAELTRFRLPAETKNALYPKLRDAKPGELAAAIDDAGLPKRYRERLRECFGL